MKISISPTAVLFLILLFIKGYLLLPAAIIAALLHECGHLLAAALLGINIARMEIDLFGAKLTPAGLLPSYKAELLLALAGPLLSLLTALLFLKAGHTFGTYLRDTSLSFAIFNLLPICDFDGGRMLHACLAPHLSLQVADRILRITSYACLLLLFLFSSCLMLRYGQSPALIVISASLFTKLFILQA